MEGIINLLRFYIFRSVVLWSLWKLQARWDFKGLAVCFWAAININETVIFQLSCGWHIPTRCTVRCQGLWLRRILLLRMALHWSTRMLRMKAGFSSKLKQTAFRRNQYGPLWYSLTIPCTGWTWRPLTRSPSWWTAPLTRRTSRRNVRITDGNIWLPK